MPTIANLKAVLGLDTKPFSKGVNKAQGAMRGLTGGIAGLIGGFGLKSLVTSSLDAADAIQKMNISTGLSSEFLSSMEQGTRLSGAGLSDLSAAAISLQRRTQLAIGKNNEYAKSFETLGLKAEEFAKLSPDEQIRTFAEAYSKLEGQQEKNIVLTTLMNKSASKLAPFFKEGAAGLAEFEAIAAKTNRTLSQDQVDAAAKANDAMQLLGDSLSGLGRNFSLELAPGIADVARMLSDVLPRAIEHIKRPFRALGTLIGGIVAMIAQLGSGNFRGAFSIARSLPSDALDAFKAQTPGRQGKPVDSAAEKRQVELLDQSTRQQAEMVRLMRGGVAAVAQ